MKTKKINKNTLLAIIFGIYCASIIIQNVLATKTFDIGIFTVTTGILVSPIVFIIQDIASEIFGYKQTKRLILLSFTMNFIAVLLFQLAIIIPPSYTYMNQAAFEVLLSSTLRLSIASFTAYITGSLINSKIMVSLKRKNEKNLFFRAISSTLVGQFCDNAIFAVVAFLFILPAPAIVSMIIGGTLFEVCYEIIFYPVTKKAIKTIESRIDAK